MPELLKPPAIPTAILDFFSGQPNFPAVAGDMAEEFQLRVRRSGIKAARLWYWRDALRSAWALTKGELRRTPGRTIITALACLLAVNILTGISLILIIYTRVSPMLVIHMMDVDWMGVTRDPSLESLVLLLQLMVAFATGWFGGRLLPGREWALLLMFTGISVCVSLAAAWYIFFSVRMSLPTPLRNFMIAVAVLRLSGFCLGSLYRRQSKAVRQSI